MSAWRGRVLVTGGTSGIGLAIAQRFASGGFHVVAAGLDAEQCEIAGSSHSPVDHPGGDGTDRLEIHELDVTDPEQVEHFVGQLDDLHVVVNAAGIILRNGQEHDPMGFQRVVEVNLTGTMRVCYAARSRLFASRGSVINLASMLSFFGSPFAPGYSASKGGVAQLTKSLAIAWGPHGVRVNALAPGWIATPMTAALRADAARDQQLMQRTPLGRWGRVEEVAAAAWFLASPDAAFITGVVLPVDGGYSIA